MVIHGTEGVFIKGIEEALGFAGNTYWFWVIDIYTYG